MCAIKPKAKGGAKMKTKITIKTLLFIVLAVLFVVPHPIHAETDVSAGSPPAEKLVQSGHFTVDIETLERHISAPPEEAIDPMAEVLENPGFETGSLFPWYSDYWTVVTTSPRSGKYCATDDGNYWIRQDFLKIPVEDITSITLWSRQPEEAIQAVDMMYSDGTYDEDIIYPLSTWRQFDVTSFLTPGKVLTGIRIWGYFRSDGDPDITYIDDISIQTLPIDTDGDGLLDDWEIRGYDHDGDGIIDVDLPAMGADPNHKDIFVEVDWMVAADHNHKPKRKAIKKVVRAFERAKVSNPDGTTGITLHVDTGNLGGGNALPHDNDLNPVWTEFDALKSANFAPEREPIFHYCIFAHNYSGGTSSGLSRGIPASDFIVSLGSWTNQVGTMKQQAGTFMHELGHNLGLRHGGNDHEHYKPNFLSIMSYSFQMDWLRFKGEDRKLDYSKFDIEDLDENHLNERRGLDLVGRDRPIRYYGTRWFDPSGIRRITNKAKSRVDWDWDGDPTETDVAVDINGRNGLSILTGHCVEWDNIVYDGGSIGPGFRASEVPEVFEELTLEEYRRMKELSIESD